MKIKSKIIFTKHALGKFEKLAKMGVKISREQVLTVIDDPEHEDTESDKPKIIASKSFDRTHVLRVVFKIENGIITIITFYPAEKGRYYEEKTSK